MVEASVPKKNKEKQAAYEKRMVHACVCLRIYALLG